MGTRTDLAVEARRLFRRSAEETAELPGVRAREEELRGLAVTEVEIINIEGAAALQKPPGRYYSAELPALVSRGDPRFEDHALVLASLLQRLLPPMPQAVLVTLLGNSEVTPDALGPLTAPSLLVTRHLKEQHPLFRELCAVSCLQPGVLGSSGMESAALISAAVRLVEPDCVIAVDALAGAEPEGLCRRVQLSDCGIAPGSGVGNDRLPLSRETLGVPVLSLGIPTVIDASALSDEASLAADFVCPRSIAAEVRSGGQLLGYAIDLALHGERLSLEELDGLLL